ncbi:MAG TPA: hypothetical protein VHO24_19510 [Opitutaceae bacterium]|nr:hypothetical protein [Opitutaceae bacterium]
MSTILTPPPKPADQRRRRGLSTDPDTRSVQIGAIGTILIHLLFFLLAPLVMRLGPKSEFRPTESPPQFSVELAPESMEQPTPLPPNKFVETNPDAPENEPDKTTNFAARNQQVAQEKPQPDAKSDRPELEGKKELDSSPIVSGSLSKPVEQPPPEPPANETPPQEQAVAAPKLEQNPLAGFEKTEGEDKLTYGSNIAKFAENPQAVPDKVEGQKNVPLIQGATANQPQIDPQRPRPRPSIVKQQQVRPAIFAENKFGTANIGPIAIDAKWSNYGAYLQRLIETVQLQWERILADSKVYPTSGSTVEVKFVLNSEGAVARVVSVESTASDSGSRACMSAITERSPYGKWTDDMIAVLGEQQEMTFKFFYQ